MLNELKKLAWPVYKYVMPILLVLVVALTILSQTGCAFLAAAQESADATRADLVGVDDKIVLILNKLAETKYKYDGAMRDIANARERGEIERMDALIQQAMAIKEAGETVWKEYQLAGVEREQLKNAYDRAVERVENAATKEEKWGSIFGTGLSVVLSLLGLGGIGGAVGGVASARGSRREADAYRVDADSYRDGLALTTEALEKVKAYSPDKWETVKGNLLAKGSTAALKKIDEVRPGNTSTTAPSA
ncbi:MAG: hypothetical protein IID05_04895 [Gemmatimonadetes bacterium]|nr:hypothetical protein [Gemmatimonadota bacterium]